MLDEERVHLIEEECGIFAVHKHDEAANLTYLGLHALQHRGQEAAGIVTLDPDTGELTTARENGLVSEGFNQAKLDTLGGSMAIGHVRYSTSGSSSLRNAQPLKAHTKYGKLALAHNGNLTNAMGLRRQFEREGSIFGTETDTEVIAHLIAKSRKDTMKDAIIDAVRQIKGAFSLVGVTDDFIFAVRDAHGVRPLVVGTLGGARVVASESSSFNLIGATVDREVEPGEMVVMYRDGTEEWLRPFAPVAPAPCIFELVYFSRPDSEIFGQHVYTTRKHMGATLARESAVPADVVVPVPDSGVPAAVGYAHEAGVPFEMGLVRSHYVGRTFIEPTSSIRHFGVKLKLSPVRAIIEGRRVVVIDDSIVRGTTCRKIVRMLRDAGAAEVHFRVASPPTISPCFYGLDTPSTKELIAANHSIDEIRDFIAADSLAYISIEGLRDAVGAVFEHGRSSYCEACFTNQYPIELEDAKYRAGR